MPAFPPGLVALFLSAIGIQDPAQFEALQEAILAGKIDDSLPALAALASFMNSMGIHGPADVEAVGTALLTRGHRTDTLNY